MPAILTTFKNLLSDPALKVSRIEIPRIQRSYAQGREDDHARRTRDRFLSAIHDALDSGTPMTLDFIYGNVNISDGNGKLIPLDGQQRLTTLFLLHWYAAHKEGIETDILDRFTYATRYSSRDFCQRLAGYTPDFSEPLSQGIRNEGWFPLDWSHDATISSMLVMIDAIHDKFSDMDNLWERLDGVRFYFLDVKEMDLTDEIYIKMNSRGKPLTSFEHFKAELIRLLRGGDKTLLKEIAQSIDRDWTDMLWPYRGDDNIIDDEFLRYFRFICDIFCYGRDMSADTPDEFTLLERYFSDSAENEGNVVMMKSLFDIWRDTAVRYSGKGGIDGFFRDFISTDHQPGKIMVPSGTFPYIDLFHDCLRNYKDGSLPRKDSFSLSKMALLYAFTVYLLHRDYIEESDFRRRIRVVWNLIRNSQQEVVDNPRGQAGNRMPAILRQIEGIILKGEVSTDICVGGEHNRPNFNIVQIEEERGKLRFTADNPQYAEPLFRLEDHPMLTGRTEAVGYDNVSLYDRFEKLFSCDPDLVDRAMLSIGNYWHRENRWYIQLGTYGPYSTGVWSSLFHRGVNSTDFGNLKDVLHKILTSSESIDDEFLQGIIDVFIADCEDNRFFPWRYYYVKYSSFRRGRYGKYTMEEGKPYELVALNTGRYESNRAYQCFLNEIGPYDTKFDIRRKKVDGGWLRCLNDAFRFEPGEGDDVRILHVPQNEDDIDTVNRIEYYRSHADHSQWQKAPEQEQ